MMEIIISLLLGIIIASAFTYYVLQETQQKKTVREYETQIQILKEQHQQAIKETKTRSLDRSRAVIKGKIAEQLAPVLPNFNYLPSDARFIGDNKPSEQALPQPNTIPLHIDRTKTKYSAPIPNGTV